MVSTGPGRNGRYNSAGFPTVYGTSNFALKHRGNLQAGETLLVLGAAGGVGLTAVELGKTMGANVIAPQGVLKSVKLRSITALILQLIINLKVFETVSKT